MQRYMNNNNNSGVVAFEIRPESICVQFINGSTYLYTASSAGVSNIAAMQHIAQVGDGLNSFINRYVRKLYAAKGC